VDFSLFRELAPAHQPQVDLQQSIKGLVSGLQAIGFADRDFRSSDKMRLKVLSDLMADGWLSRDVRWTRRRAEPLRATHAVSQAVA
jgi:hypothetical protein